MTNANRLPDRDDDEIEPSEWEMMLTQYRIAKDIYLDKMKTFWVLGTPEKGAAAYRAKEELEEMLESIAVSIIHRDEELTTEKKLYVIAGIGRMCDIDTVTGLNEIIGVDILEPLYDPEGQIDLKINEGDSIDEDNIESATENYLGIIAEKLERDFDKVIESPHFDRMLRLNNLKKAIFEIAKIGSAVTLGILLSEKIRDRN
jgi:hypothetical protein